MTCVWSILIQLHNRDSTMFMQCSTFLWPLAYILVSILGHTDKERCDGEKCARVRHEYTRCASE